MGWGWVCGGCRLGGHGARVSLGPQQEGSVYQSKKLVLIIGAVLRP